MDLSSSLAQNKYYLSYFCYVFSYIEKKGTNK